MANEKSPDIQNTNSSENKEHKTECSSCQGTGRIQPYGSRRSSKCQKCQGTGFC
ncbi:hypothetical protein [Anabaena sp. 90]|uniref:hypothetical protein n=1 Tax=Anabaena sp. 90 TaxID=46234 RepID=UPI0002F44150|nr:hypothetical protein [Anabaena sp. 90]